MFVSLNEGHLLFWRLRDRKAAARRGGFSPSLLRCRPSATAFVEKPLRACYDSLTPLREQVSAEECLAWRQRFTAELQSTGAGSA